MIPAPCLALSIVLPLVAAASPVPGRTGGPTVAVEDTMHTELPEVMIRAPRVTLNEILDRVARGEARRDSLIQDESFRATFRLLSNTVDPKKAALEFEKVMRVYKKRPNLARTVTLRQWDRKPPKKGDDDIDINASFRSDMSEEIVNFAFRPEARRDYRYRIVARDVVGDHLIYRIEFEPRSALDPTQPRGLVWVDTNEFVIVRQEVGFERSPVPLILKGIRRMVVERTHQGPHWVLHRVLLRAENTLPLPRIGRSFDFALQFDEYAINSGLPDSLFREVKR
jgi:hypothetical protein